ncbi:MAG: SDR family oxidoreductase [Bacteroidota bacterium]
MKILIIGSQGFVGAAAVAHFSGLGHEVWECGVSGKPGSRYFLVERGNPNYKTLMQAEQFDVCINAAGSPGVGFSFENPDDDFNMNVVNVQRLLSAIRKFQKSCFFILLSSAAVYGNPAMLPTPENSATSPLSPYGWHKLLAEQLCMAHAQMQHTNYCIIRIFSAYGPGLKKQLFWDLYHKLMTDGPAALWGTGQEARDFIYTADLMQAIELVIKNKEAVQPVINVGSGIETTIASAVHTLASCLNSTKEIIFGGQVKPGDPLRFKADITHLSSLGFSPNFTLQQGLEQYLLWIQKESE